jgi:hypothetical protein
MGSIFGKAKKGFGKALKPRGPGVIRPKPTDRYGQQMKPKAIRPGKKDGGMLKSVKPSQKGLSKLPKEVRNKMGYMKDGGKAKKFPDLTGDGKVTRADVLKGRGVFASGGRPGLYANIHAKRKRGGKMKKKGAKGAPTAANFARAKQTARKR